MPDGFKGQVMLCWPSDRDEIKALGAVSDLEPFVPTIDHSLSQCDSCRRSIWIGPQQLTLVRSPFVLAKKLCLFCVSEVQQTLKLTAKEVDVGIPLRDRPRRTA